MEDEIVFPRTVRKITTGDTRGNARDNSNDPDNFLVASSSSRTPPVPFFFPSVPPRTLC
jgi:hypothetical protein